MSDIAIKVDNLGKLYHIGAAQIRHDTLRDALVARFRREDRSKNDGIIWALRDVSFEVKRGEVLGVIGRNGAGKSTLLKILSRITEPTRGYAEIHGRVGSLLEVGTGFHPELTGRENLYLNGAILGMHRHEIERKFDEIVAFSEIEKFLDTPVKRYSSGMYVRLAFAVAAHLEPEILLVDEVLAVGDVAFQKKCLGKMGDVAKEGRTILFVSHNMIAVQSLCGRVFWLADGQIVDDGRPDQIVSKYMRTSSPMFAQQVWDDIDTAPGNQTVRLRRVCARPLNGSPADQITMQTPFVIEVEHWNLVPDAQLGITLHIYTEQGIVAFTTGSSPEPVSGASPFPKGLFRSTCHIPGRFLNSGIHQVLLMVVKDASSAIYQHENVIAFEVVDLSERQGAWYGREPGAVCPNLEWTTEYVDSIREA